MLGIRHQLITTEDGNVIGVILDLETFKKMELIIEDHSMAHYMDEAENDEQITLEDAINLYNLKVEGRK